MRRPPKADAASHLSLLASSVAHRKLAVRTGHDGLAHTDGETIFVPERDRDHAVIAVVVQAALLANGSLDPKIVSRLFGRATPSRRYLTLEALRAASDLDYCLPRTVRAAVEDQWDGPSSSSAQHSLQRALTRERIPPAPEQFGTIRPIKLWRAGALATVNAGSHRGKNLQTTDHPFAEPDDSSDDSKILKLLSQPLQGNSLFKLFRGEPGGKRRPKADAQSPGADQPIDSLSTVTRLGSHATLVSAVPGPVVAPPSEQPGDFCYPEWNWDHRTYREDWCRVGVFDPARVEPAGDFVVRIDSAIQRELARLGLVHRRHHRQFDGDGLDPDALVDFAVARAMGAVTDPRVFSAQLRTARDLGVIVLLDASGSTAESNPEGASVWDRQRLLAANLVAALEELGDRVAAYGFRSHGRQVSFLRIKDFDGRFDQSARRRLAVLQPGGFTRIGAAIRHSVHLASTVAGTSNRLLVVISDGFPYDDDYQGAYAEHDTRQALTEAVDQAVGCVCLTVGTSTDDATLERLWGHVSHVDLVGPPADLGRHLLPLFGSALKAANGRTRAVTTAVGAHRHIRRKERA
jgi:hypothetical protein